MIYLVDLLYIGKYIFVPFYGQMIYFLLCVVSGYLLGSINTAIIVSKKKYGKGLKDLKGDLIRWSKIAVAYIKKAAVHVKDFAIRVKDKMVDLVRKITKGDKK